MLNVTPSGDFKTTKSNATDHGYGIYSIKKVANKYHGSVLIDYTEDVFTIKILLCDL